MSKESESPVIIVPGLGDDSRKLQWATNHWRRYGLDPIVYSVGWHDGESEFQPKLKRLVDLIDKLSAKHDVVSLVGTSAGGSAVINAFIERRDIIHKVINVCGRLRIGSYTGFRSFEARSATSHSFAQSIQLCESGLESLSNNDKLKIMTVRAMFGDELVPADTTIIKGAYNTQVPTPEHVFSIGMALTVLSKPLIVFLKSSGNISKI